MKKPTTALALSGIMALFSASAFSAALPNEIFQPRGAQTVLADQKSSGGFAAEFSLQAGQNSVQALARQVRNHAQRHGFKVVASAIEPDDADLKFTRRGQALDVAIGRNRHGTIAYKADLDTNPRQSG